MEQLTVRRLRSIAAQEGIYIPFRNRKADIIHALHTQVPRRTLTYLVAVQQEAQQSNAPVKYCRCVKRLEGRKVRNPYAICRKSTRVVGKVKC